MGINGTSLNTVAVGLAPAALQQPSASLLEGLSGARGTQVKGQTNNWSNSVLPKTTWCLALQIMYLTT